ncbi:MAG: 3-demethylubiquinone-9 3-methyltransferase [Caulobacteraceae bacterium]|nr:3-demethylubiquinone-9 3-methyltransferase [Caulobacteraceae bacterium]
MQKISPFLWFDTQAEEAANFYVSIFKNSRIRRIARNGEQGPGPAGSVLVVSFELDGQQFTALNGGPQFKFTEAISLVVDCADQAEVDHMWERLGEGGQPGVCGWLKDRYGLSWQIVPVEFMQMATDPDPAKVGRVMGAMMQMTKMDIAKLREAFEG